MTTVPIDFDSPWKESLGEYLPECLALLFPEVHAGVDWSRPHIFLDTELQQVVRDAELGRRHADRLVQVWLPNGSDTWLLLHIEVQSQEETGFAERMYVYNYRIFDRYRRDVVSLAILADERAGWRPSVYTRSRWGHEIHYRYPLAKLQDWRSHQTELRNNDNPFATLVLAHLAAQETRGDTGSRGHAKIGLVRRLYERGYSKERVLSLFRFIDWLLVLPPALELQFLQAIEAIEEERKMPYITSMERVLREVSLREGLEQGLEQGRLLAKREDITRIVHARFGVIPDTLEERLAAADETALNDLLLRAVTVGSLNEL